MTRRNTRQRQLVLEAVRGRCDHPTAEQIFQDVSAQDPRVSRGTVYRNLNILVEDGQVLEVKTPQASRFDLTLDPHHHVVCLGCGMVCDAPAQYDAGMDQEVAASLGFAALRHYVVFEGLCPTCQNKQEVAE